MNIEQYKLREIDFDGDDWEFIHSLIYIRRESPVNILSVGSGNYSLEYALATEFDSKLSSFFSVDVVNQYNKENKEFYHKRTVYSTIVGRGCQNTVAIQNDCFDQGVMDEIKRNLGNSKINLLVLEFERSKDYVTKIIKEFSTILDSKYDIYFHNIAKSGESVECFREISAGKKYVVLQNTSGIGVIKNLKGACREKIKEDRDKVSSVI